MSSAILYLAIVAIWAVVLVPRWLHPRSSVHRQSATIQNEVPAPEGKEGDPGQEEGAAETGTERTAAPPAHADTPPAHAAIPPAHADTPPAHAATPPAQAATPPASPALSPAARRRHMLQARRRTLGTLVLLTVGAVAFAATHLAAAWIIPPPVIMLAGFLVLLREAALIDAERRRLTTVARHSDERSGADAPGRAGGAVAREAETPGPATSQEPGTGGTATPETSRPGELDTAPGLAATGTHGVGPRADGHVIDISDRIDGQFYDQYTDAVDRAVGD